jgi:SAM-dependent methyltransferase
MSKAVHAFFDHEAAGYEGNFLQRKSGRNVLFRTRLAIACALASGTGGALLDCATGSGEITAAVLSSSAFNTATLVDISGEMLRRTRARLANQTLCKQAGFLQTDIFEFLDNDSGTTRFDLILCLGLIAHTGRLSPLLGNLAQRLSGNGRILLQSSLDNHWGNWVWRRLMHRRVVARHGYEFSYFTHKKIELAAGQAGLSILALRKYGLGVPFLEKLSPRANYLLEVTFGRWASRHGAEVIYALGKRGEDA